METEERRVAVKQRKFLRFLQRPFKYLIKARDFYIKGLIKCSAKLDPDVALGCPVGQLAPTLPKSYSVSSVISSRGGQDYSDLVRVASSRSSESKFDHFGCSSLASNQKISGERTGGLHRSFSVGIGRIDEESSCELGDEVEIRTNIWQSSRSYSASRSRF